MHEARQEETLQRRIRIRDHCALTLLEFRFVDIRVLLSAAALHVTRTDLDLLPYNQMDAADRLKLNRRSTRKL